MWVSQKLAEFRKPSAISSIFLKIFWIFGGWKIWQIGFFFYKIKSLESTLFWLGCDVLKMDDLFQRPLWPISIILNFSKIFWWKLTSNSFQQKKNRSFDENWRNTSHISTLWVILTSFGVNDWTTDASPIFSDLPTALHLIVLLALLMKQ